MSEFQDFLHVLERGKDTFHMHTIYCIVIKHGAEGPNVSYLLIEKRESTNVPCGGYVFFPKGARALR